MPQIRLPKAAIEVVLLQAAYRETFYSHLLRAEALSIGTGDGTAAHQYSCFFVLMQEVCLRD